jgi:hypothetical protein
MITEEQLGRLRILPEASLEELLQIIRSEVSAEPSSEVPEDRIHGDIAEDAIEVSRVEEVEVNEQQLSQKPFPRVQLRRPLRPRPPLPWVREHLRRFDSEEAAEGEAEIDPESDIEHEPLPEESNNEADITFEQREDVQEMVIEQMNKLATILRRKYVAR